MGRVGGLVGGPSGNDLVGDLVGYENENSPTQKSLWGVGLGVIYSLVFFFSTNFRRNVTNLHRFLVERTVPYIYLYIYI